MELVSAIEQGSGVDLEESVADGRLDLAIVPRSEKPSQHHDRGTLFPKSA
ncbi:MAG: hypothetical protein V8S69_02485 [Dakarella massiliensis]